MSTATWVDVEELQGRFDRLEELRQDAADAERVAFQRWQTSFAAYEIAKGKASVAWTALAEGIGGL
jgi:hypothetical protein